MPQAQDPVPATGRGEMTRVDLDRTILLLGPTGAGKSDLAVELAARFPLGIISVDSALVYRGLDIGTAKPPRELRARVPHHLIDIADPGERYSVGRFLGDAAAAIALVRAQGLVPLLAGGTMLYFRALQSGLAPLPAGDAALRAELDARAARDGWPALHAELAARDPVAAARIGPNDRQRIQRALEVCLLTGQPLSARQQQDLRGGTSAGTLKIVLAPGDRAALAARLAARFHAMMDAGFLAEVEALFRRGDLDADLPALRAVGYRQLWAHLAGQCPLDRAVEQGIIATRQLARRQLTWLRAEPDARWYDCLDPGNSGPISDAIEAWWCEGRL